MTVRIRTNRDLYVFVTDLGAKPSTRTLEDYLKTLWHLAARHSDVDALSLATFAELLRASFVDVPPATTPTFADADRADVYALEGYDRWERTILVQISDLHEMASRGALSNDQRYFGVDSPRGARWYNFVPSAYLESAVAGAFDGHTPTDSGSALVPGAIAVMDPFGNVTSEDPAALDEPLFEIRRLSWDLLTEFLLCGQQHE